MMRASGDGTQAMRWKTGRRSSNVDDRRGQTPGVGLPNLFPRGMGSRSGKRRVGKGSLLVTVLLMLGLYFLGVDPRILLQSGGVLVPGAGERQAQPRSPQEDQLAEFISVVLADTEDTWNALFQKAGRDYREPTLVLFSGAVSSACGTAQSAMGPFYCPPDQKVYIDLSFYDDLKHRHGAPGDFAQAYVVAHEVGHHVQNLLGLSSKVQAMRQRVSEAEGNRLSVKLELQADCFAGVWGHFADRSRQLLEAGDIEEALKAATSIGDDRLQRETQGRVVPESFTHGTSEQRVRWFKRGIEHGDLAQCNTFEAEQL